MEYRKYAKSDTERLKGLMTLFNSYLVFSVFLFAYNLSLSFSIDSDSYITYQPNSQYVKMQLIKQNPDELLVLALPKKAAEIPILENIQIVDTIIAPKAKNDIVVDEEQVNKPIIDSIEITEKGKDHSEMNGNGGKGEQNVEGGGGSEGVFYIAEKMPTFPGGIPALSYYIAQNINYPALAQKRGIEGIVYVLFCITKLGTVAEVSIARGVNPLLDEEALRVVQSLPKWNPGEQGGNKVNVWYTLPIDFHIN